MEIVRKYSQVILVIYKDDLSGTDVELQMPRGQILIDNEDDIEKWKKIISQLNSL